MPQEQPQTMTIGELAAKAIELANTHGSLKPVRDIAGECVVSLDWHPQLREIVIQTADPIVFELDEEGE